jgi:hypothetical protein
MRFVRASDEMTAPDAPALEPFLFSASPWMNRFSRTGDPATGDFSDANVIGKFGDVPDDLSGL